MKTILEAILYFINMVLSYVTIIIIFLFDCIIFGTFITIINNQTLARLYDMPVITYFDAVGVLFLIKIITLMITSSKIYDKNNKKIN